LAKIDRGSVAPEKLVKHLSDPAIAGLSITSTSLLRRVKAHDEQAWKRLVELYHPLVYSWCRRAGLQEADAANVGQEVFSAVLYGITDFHRDKPGDTFRGWLRRITKFKLCDHFRRIRKEVPGVGGETPEDLFVFEPLDDSAEATAEAGLVYRRALELLSIEFEERTRLAFWGVVIENKRPEDVARELGMTANAVYVAKSRILCRLREEFADLLEL